MKAVVFNPSAVDQGCCQLSRNIKNANKKCQAFSALTYCATLAAPAMICPKAASPPPPTPSLRPTFVLNSNPRPPGSNFLAVTSTEQLTEVGDAFSI